MITAILAFFIDAVMGDPRSKLHPVVLIGNLIAGIEGMLYGKEDSDKKKLVLGGILVVLVLLFTFAVVNGIMNLVKMLDNIYVVTLIEAFFLSFTISPNSLAAAGKELYGYLVADDLDNARYKVGWIVGRDTEDLTPGEVSRATIETIAENTVDGIIAPLFYFAIGGVPLAFLYRAVNTMDSMVGYKNDRYIYFGRVAARADDVLGYIPARITGLLFVVSAFILGYDGKKAWKILRRDASKHPSPNGGWAEATVAGALHIRLGGFNSYFGKIHFREYMGDPVEEIGFDHIMKTIRLMYTDTILFLIICHIIFVICSMGVL
ncbi:MAG: cobalamin biosynthesis protein CobD [Anaerovibrio sp.]|uniref:adenosylcobinamide-phosphate synthase CbiB n=1 Tax=Anaerovibrio sp. TaxID=1872532 RepID=UPI001B1FE6F9|nr:adenosylcobinamide-phosphate synthase CbiB [Anaerovibrio sp.]MBO5589508.1 cobalamin biosynthesis protein CobD [Anaerovibrio sp.]MBO6246884.1 cobalamin biosynthesis protein CobD [Anaerovibrio sp.]